MALRLFNTLTRTVEAFVPVDPTGHSVGLYCCGPTVYDYGHIGNFRTFVFADLVCRYLEFRGYRVNSVMNITDVEDKIIARLREAGAGLREYTRRYEAAFLEDSIVLNLRPPEHRPRATEHIAEIVGLIAELFARGFAYQAADGSVYFSIERYRAAGRRYGQLVNLNFDQMRAGERVRHDEYGKEAVADFALWKARVPEDGEVFWASPWGEGRPGWHVECSAMSRKLLGPSFDLHLGGEDLVFPHHEDEIAQSEGAGGQLPGQPFVKYWLHGAHLLVEGRKMAKSQGNYFTLRDLLGRGFTGREIRYLLLSAHYRESFNFTFDGLLSARGALARLDECLARLSETAGGASAEPDAELVGRFTAALDDDLNIAAAWGAVFEWVREINRAVAAGGLTSIQAAAGLAAWRRLDTVLGLAPPAAGPAIPPEIAALLEARQAARQARDFTRADALRQDLKSRGWLIEDTPKGPRLKRV
jgi:cysteinyl-tRNA synthetase